MKFGIVSSLKKYLQDYRYCIGFIEGYQFLGEFDYKNIHWLDLNGYNNGWFADPFILSVNQEYIVLLAEEWFYPINHGRISRLTISRNGFRLLDVQPILQLDTHLSFPYCIRENGTTYICPENQESGCVIIYEYDDVSQRLIKPVKLLEKPLMDVQIIHENGIYYMMGVEYLTGRQDDTRNLQIYSAKKLGGPYMYRHTLRSNNCDKRGAGLIFKRNAQIIRPSQCCDNNEYGTAVIFNELTIEQHKVTERQIGRITRQKNKHNGLVLHTFNQSGDITVIDGWDYTHRYIGRFVESMRKEIRKFFKVK